MSPPVLYALGLEAALRALAERFQQQHNLTVGFADDGRPKPLADAVRVLLYQAVRELLVNVVKHARAGRAGVSIGRQGDTVRIEVTDDGAGFDHAEERIRSGGEGGGRPVQHPRAAAPPGGRLRRRDGARPGNTDRPDRSAATGGNRLREGTMSIRIILADDHRIIREGLCSLLEKEPGLEVAAEADNGRTAVHLVQALLAEEGLPCAVRLAADRTALIAALEEGTFDLVLADFVTAGCTALAALKGGATDFVLKGRLARLAPAVRSTIEEARQRRERRWAEEGMRGSEEKYRSLVDHLAIGISLISPEMEILSLNRQMREWFPGLDLSKRLVCYRTFNDPPGETVCAFCPVAKTFRDGEVHEAVTETLWRGEVRPYQIVASPVKNSAGQVVAVIEMVKDITARQRAEEELRHSNELMRALIAASPLAIVMLDPAGAVIMWNAAAERIFGWSEAEALGRPAPFVPAEKWAELDRLRARVLGGEVLTGVEVRRRRKDGAAIDLSVHAAPVHDAGGKASAIMSLIADVTERKRVERQLVQSERRFRTAFEDAATGMCLTALDGRFLTVNRSLCEMLGYCRGSWPP